MERVHDSTVWLNLRNREDEIMLGQIDDSTCIYCIDIRDLHDLLVGGRQPDLLLKRIRTKSFEDRSECHHVLNQRGEILGKSASTMDCAQVSRPTITLAAIASLTASAATASKVSRFHRRLYLSSPWRSARSSRHLRFFDGLIVVSTINCQAHLGALLSDHSPCDL